MEAHAQTDLTDKVVILQMGEFSLIEAAQTSHLLSSLEKAHSDGAAAVVLEIDCPGGFAISSRQVVEKLGTLTGLKTFAFIKGDAVAGAAMVALATDEIYFAPDKTLGTAKKPNSIDWRGKNDALPTRLVKKTYADYAEKMSEIVAAKGRDAVLINGFIDPSIEVKIGDHILSEADDVLVLDGDSLVSAGEIASVADLVKSAEIAGEMVTLQMAEEAPALESAKSDEEQKKKTAVIKEELKEPGFGETQVENYAGKVVVIDVGKESLIRETKFRFMERILAKAEKDGAEAIIFELHTPGGYLWETRDLMTKLQSVKTPTYAFVNPEASSAGSMIAIATDKIYMHKPSTIGASAIVAGGEGLDGAMKEKVEQTFIDTVAQVAEANGRDPNLCQAFVKIELDYYAMIPTVEPDGSQSSRTVLAVAEGDLLSLSATEALQMVNGKPLFADGSAQTIEELVKKEGLTGSIVRTKPLGFEAVADWIVKLAPLLLLLAMAGVYLESNSPGFGVAGIIALICFAIFFFGHHVAGKLAGYEVIGVFLIGLALVVVELFVLPGMLFIGAIGLLLMVGALMFAMIDKFDFKVIDGDFEFGRFTDGMQTPVFNMMIGMIGAGLLILALMRYLPEMSFMKRRTLAGVTSADMSGAGAPAGMENLVGLEGTATCDLRPAGSGKFGGKLLDVTTGSEFLPAGTAVRIVRDEGVRIVVEKV